MPALLFSCQGDLTSEDARAGLVRTSVSFTEITKSPDNWTADIFIYENDKAGRIDTYQRCSLSDNLSTIVASRTGDKVMAVIVNPPKTEYDWSEINSFEALTRMYADMAEEVPGRPVMSGVTSFHAGGDNVQKISIKKIMSGVLLHSLKCDFSGTSYSGESLKNASVYLANVNTRAELFLEEGFLPESPVNSECTPEGADSASPQPGMFRKELGEVGKKTIYPDAGLYCYPNECEQETPGSRFTRLIITGEILGQRYYWPIRINRGDFGNIEGTPGISRNCQYVFDIVLRRAGVTSPLEDVGVGTIEVGTVLKPWTVLDQKEIIF